MEFYGSLEISILFIVLKLVGHGEAKPVFHVALLHGSKAAEAK